MTIGQTLYELLYSRKPWRAVEPDGRERFENAAEELLVELLDSMGEQIDTMDSDFHTTEDVGTWLREWRKCITEHGEIPA